MRLYFFPYCIVVAAFVLLQSCKEQRAATPTVEQKQQALLQTRMQQYNQSIYPQIQSQVKSGDMITRLGSDITSELFRQMNQTDASFSHCGIASKENDTLFVYHAIGGEFNPDQKLKRETLYAFGHPAENKGLGVFAMQMNAGQQKTLTQVVQKFYQNQTPFDMDFDFATNDRLYCAEFVAKSYGLAKGDSAWMRFSKRGNFRYVAVDNLLRGKGMKEVIRSSY